MNSVEVDVTVTDASGHFIRDLTLTDFDILEDGKSQELSAFGIVDLPVEPRPQPSPLSSIWPEPDIRSNEVSDARLFVIVLDDIHTDPLRSALVKQTTRQFIERYIGPRDLVSVVHTSGRTDSGQDFTQVKKLMLGSVDKFVGQKLRSSILERLEAYERLQGIPSQADIRMQRVVDSLDAERARRAQNMLATLQHVAQVVGDIRGRRKSVILMSEGLDYDIQSGVAQTSSGLTTFTSNDAPSVLNRLRQAIAAITRANATLYAIDPRGLATGGDNGIEVQSPPENPFLGLGSTAFQDEIRRSQDSLRILSEETGGVASVTSNDLSAIFDRILKDNSTYYLLGYHSSNTRRDGRFRKIEVRVKKSGAQVRARKGYFAPSSRESIGASPAIPGPEPPVLRELLRMPLPFEGIPLRSFEATFKGTDGNHSVLFGLEVDASNFKFKRDKGLYINRLEALVIAVDGRGKFVDRDWQSMQLSLREETQKVVLAEGVRFLFRLELPPGRYQLRAGAYEAESGAKGSVYYEFQVPDFAREPLAVSGLVLTSTRAASTPTPRPDPELAALLQQRQPTGSREFTNVEDLGVAVSIYQDKDKPLESMDVVTTIRGEDGQVRFNSTMQVSTDELGQASGGYGHMVKVPLADLPSGNYVLRVEARSRVRDNAIVVRELPLKIRASEQDRR